MWISDLADARDYGQAERRVVQSSIHLPAARHVNALAGWSSVRGEKMLSDTACQEAFKETSDAKLIGISLVIQEFTQLTG